MRKYENGGNHDKETKALADHEIRGQREDALLAEMKRVGDQQEKLTNMLSRNTVQRREYKAVDGVAIPLDSGTSTAVIVNRGTYPVVVEYVGYQTRHIVHAGWAIPYLPDAFEIDVEGMTGLIIRHGAAALSATEQAAMDMYYSVDDVPANKTNAMDATVLLSNRRK